MNVRNCKSCGKLFNYITGMPLCPACKEGLEAKFQEVKKYVQENKIASVASVAKECDVTETQIRQWVREERLVFADGSMSGIACEVCGVGILTGRFCEKCKANMVNTLNSAIKRPQQPVQQPKKDTKDSPRMRFI